MQAVMRAAGPHTARPGASKRPYSPPILVRYGDVRDLTQAGSAGTQESTFNNRCGRTNRNKPCVSDRSLKENLARVGEHAMGFGLYLFDFKEQYKDAFGRARQFGVMADEVEAVMPEAVMLRADGFKAVYYEMLGIGR
jgi:hypothetical protein